jgi:hypothetical protein
MSTHQEADRTDRQLCESSRSCCCTAVAQGQKWHPSGARNRHHKALTCGYVCSPDGIRTRATALRGRRPRPLDNGAVRLHSALWLGYQDSNLD